MSASPHSLAAAIRGSTRTELVVIGVVLFFYCLITAVLVASWVGHAAALQMQVAGMGLGLMYAVSIWHATRVMGGRQAAIFFVLAGAVTFFAEYMGSHYDWFFGAYDYTDALGPRLGGVPVLVIVVWGVVLYAAYMLVDWLMDLGGVRRGTTWYGKVAWSALIGLATGVLLSAFDLMVDPFAVSRVWQDVLGGTSWWWWSGGPTSRGSPSGRDPVASRSRTSWDGSACRSSSSSCSRCSSRTRTGSRAG